MAIRNVESGKSGGIGPVRYVEKGVTVNIPVAYVVEGGKTALLYGEDSLYLYNRGKMSGVLGGFTVEGNSQITITEESDHLAIRCPARAAMGGKIKSNVIDLSAYSTLYAEYEYVNGSTGETITSSWNQFYMYVYDTEGVGSNAVLAPYETSASCGNMGESRYIQFMPMYNTSMSDEYDVILKIYSLRVEK